MGGEIKCINEEDAQEDDEKDKNKCDPLKNPFDSDVNVSCKNGVCKFKCDDGTASIASATCFNGKWNINDKFAIKCEGKTTTTKKSTTTTTEPPTTTTEEFCGKKCQKQKEKEQKEKDKENENNNNNDGEEECDKKMSHSSSPSLLLLFSFSLSFSFCSFSFCFWHFLPQNSSVVVVGGSVVVVVDFLVVVVLPSHLIANLSLIFHLPLKQVADAMLAVPSSHLNLQTPFLQETLTSESIGFLSGSHLFLSFSSSSWASSSLMHLILPSAGGNQIGESPFGKQKI